MEYLYYSLLFASLYFFLGLGLTLILTPPKLTKYAYLVSPLVGYCYLTMAGWFCYGMNLRGTDSYATALLLPPAAFLGYAMWRPALRARAKVRPEMVAPLIIGIVGFLVVSLPLVNNGEGATSLSIGNNDLPAYAVLARYLKEFSPSQRIACVDQVDAFYLLAFKFGAFLSTAYPSSLFNAELYKLQSISVNTFFSFGAPLVYAAAREVFRYKAHPAAGAAALYALSPVLYYTAYHGFGAQLIATALGLAILIVNASAMDSCKRLYDWFSYFPLAVLLNWGIFATYANAFPIVYGFVFCYLLSTLTQGRRKSALHFSLFLVLITVLLASLSPWRAKHLLSFLIWTATADAGWHVPFISPDMVTGLTFSNVSFLPLFGFRHYAGYFVALLVIAAGLVAVYKKDRRLSVMTGASLIFVCGAYLVAGWPRSESGWGGYKSYKFISFVLPQTLLCALMLFRNLDVLSGTIAARLLTVPLGALILGSGVSCYYTVQAATASGILVTRDQADLAKLEDDPSIESINLLGSGPWQTMWAAHFLLRKQLYFETQTYFRSTPLDGEWDLRFVREPGVHPVRINAPGHTIPVNPSYALERRPSTLEAHLGNGWYPSEPGHTWMGSESGAATVILTSRCEQLSVDLRAAFWPLNRENRLSIYLAGRKIADCADYRSCELSGIALSSGENLLEFKPALAAASPSAGDRRLLSYAFQSIEITQTAASGCQEPKSLLPVNEPSSPMIDATRHR